MTEINFKQVDVFTNKKFKGNPVAVFFDADNLSSEEMQAIASWTNLSETTFVLKPTTKDADYRLRIFTTANELPFAGHPTIGSCFALIESGLVQSHDGKLIQECSAGLVEILVDGDASNPSDLFLSFKLPYFHITSIDESLELAIDEALKIPAGSCSIVESPVLLDVGPKWLTIQLSEGNDVLNLEPNYAEVLRLSLLYGWTGLQVFGKHSNGTYESRSFPLAVGVKEDPACGSGAGAIGVYLSMISAKDTRSVDVSQGCKIGRDAKLRVSVENFTDKPTISVGGQAVTCIKGTYIA
jgi:PhzF family phenazine biosynthesis protein